MLRIPCGFRAYALMHVWFCTYLAAPDSQVDQASIVAGKLWTALLQGAASVLQMHSLLAGRLCILLVLLSEICFTLFVWISQLCKISQIHPRRSRDVLKKIFKANASLLHLLQGDL